MILLVFTSISSLFQFSPNKTSSLKCANCGANSPNVFLPAVCTIFFISFTKPSVIYNDFTHLSISCLFALLRTLPSRIVAFGADGCSSFTVFPNTLPPEVANSLQKCINNRRCYIPPDWESYQDLVILFDSWILVCDFRSAPALSGKISGKFTKSSFVMNFFCARGSSGFILTTQ